MQLARPASRDVERFAGDLEPLLGSTAKVGLAVSGGPDSAALLLLAAAVRPNMVEAATVDHALRPESRSETEFVAGLCASLGVPHHILTISWIEKPLSAIQERARAGRYRLLGGWAAERGLAAVATAHHLDDQAETFLMRLRRGAGVKGLAGMRPVSVLDNLTVVRPLLGWSHARLEAVCAACGAQPLDDPSNADEQFERVRVRRALKAADWLDAEAVASSARHLADADESIEWAAEREWQRAVTAGGSEIVYAASDAPREVLRRIIMRAVAELATEGSGAEPRGREVDQLLSALRAGESATLRGVQCTGGDQWSFRPARPRR